MMSAIVFMSTLCFLEKAFSPKYWKTWMVLIFAIAHNTVVNILNKKPFQLWVNILGQVYKMEFY